MFKVKPKVIEILYLGIITHHFVKKYCPSIVFNITHTTITVFKHAAIGAFRSYIIKANNDTLSNKHELSFIVSQGSVLMQIVYCMYIKHVSAII